jgi:hypothetical protein
LVHPELKSLGACQISFDFLHAHVDGQHENMDVAPHTFTRVGSGWRLKHKGGHVVFEEKHLRSLTWVGGAAPLQVLEGSAGWRHSQAPFLFQVGSVLRLGWWQGRSLHSLDREERFGGAPSLQSHAKGMSMILLVKLNDFVIMQSRIASLMYLKAARHKGEVLNKALA